MAESEGKKFTSPKLDDDASDESALAKSAPAAGEGDKRPPGQAVKARPASARHDDEDEDDEDGDDEDDDEDDDEEEVEAAQPPKRPVAAKAKPAPAPAKKAKGSVYRKAPARRQAVVRRPARHFVPYIVLGLAFVALHVWFDFPFQPIACIGIAIVVWAYLQIGSANEIVSDGWG